jgi:hypothetical protein
LFPRFGPKPWISNGCMSATSPASR